MKPGLEKKTEVYCQHMERLTGIPCYPVDLEEKDECREPLCSLCQTCESIRGGLCDGWQEVRAGCMEAFRWSNFNMFLCHSGLLMVCTFITDKGGRPVGGITTGPICAGTMDDNLQLVASSQLREVISTQPCYNMEQIQGLAEVLDAISVSLSESVHHLSAKYFTDQQSYVNREYTKHMRALAGGDAYLYPIALERKLRLAINNKDREASMVLLNQMLAYIYTSNNYDLKPIRVRAWELLTVLSRAAADAGADFTELQLRNDDFRDRILKCRSLEGLTARISGILQQYLAAAFDLKTGGHGQIARWVLEYVEAHYQEKIRLADIAEEVHLSAPYLCTVFKNSTGESISGCINRIRIEHARILLQDPSLSLVQVANLCGFEEQSYFTKIFRSYTGVSPRKYRLQR